MQGKVLLKEAVFFSSKNVLLSQGKLSSLKQRNHFALLFCQFKGSV